MAVCPFFSSAQFSPPDEKLKAAEEYIYPINPGQPGSLSGTMGELRSTHFHSGIDIRTDNRIGLPVLASKSGYISRVSISPSGYGNALYITHNDGNTTVYAHLDRFRGPIADYVLQEHYRRKSHVLSLYFRAGQFPVKQGDTIAYSGNSGSSGGPHLHFDIRDRDNLALNPLKVQAFPEIVDNLPPAVETVALRTLDIDSRINHGFGRFEFKAVRVGNDYVLQEPILAKGLIGVEILAKDRLAPGSRFHGGVNYIEMRVDDQLKFRQAIEKINFSTTRTIYRLMDFKTLRRQGDRFYKLYVDDGNDLHFYRDSPGRGKISVHPDRPTQVVVTMNDTYGNSSKLSFSLTPAPASQVVNALKPLIEPISYEIIDNVLVVSAGPCDSEVTSARVYNNGQEITRDADYGNDGRLVYLFDLRKTIPDSIAVCESSVAPQIKATVPSGREYTYYSDFIDIRFPTNSLYDTVYLQLSTRVNENGHTEYSIGSETIPLKQSIHVALRPSGISSWQRNMAVCQIGDEGAEWLGGTWQNGRVHFSTRNFGNFTILQDSVPPEIRTVALNASQAKFRIRDGLSGIASFEAKIDGKWLLMMYDPKTATIWSEKLDKARPLKGQFELTVTDNAGNTVSLTEYIP